MRHQVGGQRREQRKLRLQRFQLAALGGGHSSVRLHLGKQGVPQARLVAVRCVQQKIGAGLKGANIQILPCSDLRPHPQCKGHLMPAEQRVPHHAPRKADIPRGKAAAAVGVGVLLAQTGVQVQYGILGQGGSQHGI